MKYYKDGKCYNAATAEEVAYYSYGNVGDLEHYEETLYRTKKGAWFIVGEGGPMSHYAKNVGQNSISGGSNFEILSEKGALRWLEDHNEFDAIGEHFASEIEEA